MRPIWYPHYCFLFIRNDCLELLSHCTNSSANKYCDIIAPSNTEGHCISLKQFLHPSAYGNDVVSPIGDSVHNPCYPNPCAEGFFCSIDRTCEGNNKGCTPFICQPGCIIGTTPGIILPKSNSVRVSLVSHSQNGCFGYLNCSATTEDFCEWNGMIISEI